MGKEPRPSRATGGCLCKAVRYQVTGPLRKVVDCHCTQCRRTSGHFAAATASWKKDLQIVDNGGLRWYESSVSARRGFCQICGSSIFWESYESKWISIMAGTLDEPTGLRTEAGIFVGDAGDYYDLPDVPVNHPDGSHGLLPEE